mmetsp:Transcript_314/g.573  ORF Transcript_314/g.573 Transcript_314/m.573 type:complete len:217 (-) Transcript_314:4781-5431(-)
MAIIFKSSTLSFRMRYDTGTVEATISLTGPVLSIVVCETALENQVKSDVLRDASNASACADCNGFLWQVFIWSSSSIDTGSIFGTIALQNRHLNPKASFLTPEQQRDIPDWDTCIADAAFLPLSHRRRTLPVSICNCSTGLVVVQAILSIPAGSTSDDGQCTSSSFFNTDWLDSIILSFAAGAWRLLAFCVESDDCFGMSAKCKFGLRKDERLNTV